MYSIIRIHEDPMRTHVRGQDQFLDDDFAELRADAVRRLAAVSIAIAIGLLGWGLVDRRVGIPEIWLVVVPIAGPAGASWWLLPRSRLGAVVALYAGLVAGVSSAAAIYGSSSLLFTLPLALMVVPLLVGPAASWTLAVGTGAVVWTLHEQALSGFGDIDVLSVLALLGFSLLLSRIAFRPMSTMIDWAWAGYQAEQRKTEEVRLHQAELAQVSKSLAEACERLEQLNVELAAARRAAEDARRLKDQFVTTISHELRTPLNLIIGFSDMLVNGPATGATAKALPALVQRDVDTIYRNACHLSTLIDDVLDLSRLEAHRLAMRKERCFLPAVLEGAITSVAALYDRAGLSLTACLPEDLPSLYVDPTRIRQVLINLLANAVRYVEQGGVSVTAQWEGGDVIVSVADTGVGIPPDDLPYVFEPFRQTGQARRRGGFGLGLTVSKQFVEMHGGSMWVESQPDRGSTFRFTLPVTDNVAAVAPGLSVHPMYGGQANGRVDRTILVLHRDDESARVFERYLDDYRVVSTTSVLEAARLGRKERISAIVVCDDDEGSAQALVDVALRHHERVPVVRYVLRTRTSAGRDLGVAAFLSKPVSRDEIRATLRRLKLRPRRILIIDDEPEMLRLLGAMLRAIVPNSLIQTAADGLEGLRVATEIFGDRIPDVVFLDLLMPNLDGYGLLRQWSAHPRWREVPVVVVSAASEEDHDAIACDSLEIRRQGGFGVGEMIQVIRGGLGGLSTLSQWSAAE